MSELRRALAPEGTYVLIGHDGYGATAGRWFGSIPRFVRLLVRSPFVSQRVAPREAKESDRLGVLRELADAGKLTPVIDRTFPLSEVADAVRCLQEGRAQGKVVITMP